MSVSSSEGQCTWCLSPLPSSRRKFCTDECGRRHHSRRQYGDADGYGAVLAERRCIDCGESLPSAATQGTGLRKLCQDCRRARWRKKSQRRRDRKTENGQTPYTREEIFDRDNWTCQLCGDPVDQTASFPEPLMASIDHIVALADDGPDIAENVHTAHLICNWSRGGTDSQRLHGPAANRWTGSYRGD